MSLKTLYALRHAKAMNGNDGTADFDRPLAPEGIAACTRVAALMQEKNLVPERVICSPALRTRQTALAVLEACGAPVSPVFVDKLYLASANDILAQLHATDPTVTSLLLVCHNPGIQHVCHMLAGHGDAALREKLELDFPTAALAVIDFDGEWKDLQPGMGNLVDFVTR